LKKTTTTKTDRMFFVKRHVCAKPNIIIKSTQVNNLRISEFFPPDVICLNYLFTT